MTETPEKILIIRLSSIGDIVQCSGVPRNLKKQFPKSEIHWLIRSDNIELVKFNPFINRVIVFDRSQGLSGWMRLASGLASENYTHVYDAHNNVRSRLLTPRLKPKFFIRRSKNRFKRFLLFWLKINLFPKPYKPAESYVTPLEPWGVKSDHGGGDLHVDPLTKEKVKKLIPHGVSKLIALAPATAWMKKTWPENYWKDLITEILSKTDYHIVIFGGPQDEFCKKLLIDPLRITSFQGRFSLLETAAAANLCDTLIVGDTGLMHMTESLGKDIIGLLGPTPFGNPSREKSQTLEVSLWCRPCSKDGSGICINPQFQKCMKEIKPERVFEALQKQVGQ